MIFWDGFFALLEFLVDWFDWPCDSKHNSPRLKNRTAESPSRRRTKQLFYALCILLIIFLAWMAVSN